MSNRRIHSSRGDWRISSFLILRKVMVSMDGRLNIGGHTGGIYRNWLGRFGFGECGEGPDSGGVAAARTGRVGPGLRTRAPRRPRVRTADSGQRKKMSRTHSISETCVGECYSLVTLLVFYHDIIQVVYMKVLQ